MIEHSAATLSNTFMTTQAASLPFWGDVTSAQAAPMQVVRGLAEVVALQPLLLKIAAMSGQEHEATDLAFFLSTPKALKKTPCVVLHRASPLDEHAVEGYRGAVVLFEYRSRGVGTRVYSTADATGLRTIFAPAPARAALAASAARALVEQGAHVVHLAYHTEGGFSRDEEAGLQAAAGDVMETDDAGSQHPAVPMAMVTYPPAAAEAMGAVLRKPGRRFGLIRLPAACQWSLLERCMPMHLPIKSTFDATIACMSKKTRGNFRYYRKLAERELGCVFVPEVRMSREEFVTFSRGCAYAHMVSDELAEFRYRSMAMVAEPVFCGVRDGEGRWLSLIGGLRNGTEMEIDWQLNREDLPRYSLTTVARAYLIEQEVRRGSTKFSLAGGSIHPMMRYFARERVAELTVKRNSIYTRLLSRFGQKVFPQDNYVGQILRDSTYAWRGWQEGRKGLDGLAAGCADVPQGRALAV